MKGNSYLFHNLTLIKTPAEGPSITTSLGSRDELIGAIEDLFGVPADVIRAAIDGVDLGADIYS